MSAPLPPANGHAPARPRILIVESQSRYLKHAVLVLENEGYEVRTAPDAAQAVYQLLDQRPGLILMGAALRGMDGMTLGMHLKADGATRGITVVAWVASTAKHGPEDAASAGCDGCIVKSVDASTLGKEIAPFLFDAASAHAQDPLYRRKLKILVVDDNELNRELLAELFVSEGHLARTAADGEQALAILEAEPIDAVISDLMMPLVDGYQLCHKIRSDARLDDVPVIIYSGTLISAASEALATNLGAVRFLRKPAPLATINATLLEVLGEVETRTRKALAAEGPQGQAHKVTAQLLDAHHDLLLLSRALERSDETLRKKNAEFEEDLRLARETNLALLPRSFPSLPRGTPAAESALQFHQRFTPKGTVSGDFFDVHELSDTKAGLFICDVMGHGVRAALVTAVIRGIFGELARTQPDPGEVLAGINRALVPILRQAGAPMFASAFYLTADTVSGEIQYANAGHPSPFLVRAESGAIERLGVRGHAHGPALGVVPEAHYPTGRRVVAPRDLVLLFTDGIFEVEGADEEQFGQERLVEAVRCRVGLPAEQLFDELFEEVHAFSATDEFEDDVCLLGMEVGAGIGPADTSDHHAGLTADPV